MDVGIAFLGLLAVTIAVPISNSAPRAAVRNGTYVGVYSTGYDQDFFLGIPYAQQPVGDLRFTVPQSLNESWEGERNAIEYSDICVGYGTDSIWYPQSESCLTLNIIRHSSVTEDSNLPVGVYIHGGGYYMGSGRDQRYNTSFIIDNANRIGKPFIGVTFNYRLSAWGLLASKEVNESGNTNIALRDQRLALHWIQENIKAFGGDPAQVTIWGESAGAISVGHHLTAYGGRDDSLFRGAILESGGPIAPNTVNTTALQGAYDELVSEAGCTLSTDTLQCLRDTPFEQLNSILNNSALSVTLSTPVIDGDIVSDKGSAQLDRNEFVKVPIIAGTNTDEGASFGPTGINTTEQFYQYLTNGTTGYTLNEIEATRILQLYPDIPSQGIPAYLGDQRVPSMGWEWRRTSAYTGDQFMHANRRRQCDAWASNSVPTYCYRFNVHANDNPLLAGVAHFEEVSFVFYNIHNVGYHYGNPFNGVPDSYIQLSQLMTSMWASFIHDLDPNVASSDVRWVPYDDEDPLDLVFDANRTSYMEPDTWRKAGIDYINSIALEAYGR